MSNEELRKRIKAITDEILREQAAEIEKEAKAFPAWGRIAKTPSPAIRHTWFDEDWKYGDVVTSANGKAMIVHEDWGLVLDSNQPNDPQVGTVVRLAGDWRRIVDHTAWGDDTITYKVGFDPGRPVKIRGMVTDT